MLSRVFKSRKNAAMNRSNITWCRGFLLLAAVVSALSVRGDETATRPRRDDIAKLVRQLGSDDFKVREEASRRLLQIGLPARGSAGGSEESRSGNPAALS